MPSPFVRWRTCRSATTIESSTGPSPTTSCRASSTSSKTGIRPRADFVFFAPRSRTGNDSVELAMRSLEVRRLGRMAYGEALALQRALVDQRRGDRITDALLLVEHPAVLTVGVRGDGGRAHILAAPEHLARRGIEVHDTGR